ncbi:MAG: SAM-dependent methyltransferase [Phycisphaerales bacterium]|jgi:23S rRNA (cytidine1920-2'-O)/16S rRNA (cytidine1409-2'-O)-methyltransferase
MEASDDPPLASRAGLKLRHALQAFDLPVTGLTCGDFGCNVGGFTDVLLRAGATRVFAVDTGYGALAWRLRNDPRVVAMERTNALHAERPEGGVDLVVLDLAWTPQRLAVPAALRWLRPGGRIVSLVKPHYELLESEKAWLDRGFLPHDRVPAVVERVRSGMPALGARVLADTPSPITGGKTARRAGSPGNLEWLMLLEVAG